MKHRSILLFPAIAALLIGCTKQTSEGLQSSTVTAPQAVVINDKAIKPELVTIAVPDGKSVLADIYKQHIETAEDSQLSDGRYVSYWNGHQFTLNDKEYFVGFAEATPPSEIEYPAPEDMVTISQATYEFVGNKWKLKAVQHGVGKFGSNNKAPVVDTIKKTTVFPDAQGKFILATPTAIFANAGINIFFFEIFSFSPEDSQWKYLGNVNAGSENSGGCAHEAGSATSTNCVESTGILQFSAAENSRWPVLKVVLQGTELGEDGNAATLTDKNSVSYRYDDKSSTYLPIN